MRKTKVSTSNCPATRGVSAAATIASKLARMATASPDASDSPGLVKASPDILSTDQLVSELEKQRASLLKDMSTLILESAKPLQSSMDALRETVNHFNNRLVAAETLAGDNFECITSTEKTVKMLEAQNKSLQDRLVDLENRSRRVNLRIINIPEGSERGRDPTEFISDLLMENLGAGVLTRPPELERAHRSLAPKPGPGGRPRPFVICFHRFQEREKVLRWARQHELKHRETTLRVYPDVSAITAKKRAAFNKIKQALYQKGIKFRLDVLCLQRERS